MGAKAVTEAQDILDALNLNEVTSILETRSIVPDTQEEAKILSILNREPMHVDELVRHCQLDTKDVHSTLTMMEMKGKVRNLGGMHYVRSR